MRQLVVSAAIPFMLLCVAAQGRNMSAQAVEKEITRSVTFAVVPTAEGKVGECGVRSVQDLEAGSGSPEFPPSAEFVHAACTDSLAKGPNWVPEEDDSGGFREILEVCMWSKAIPDSPICRVEVQAKFADELPLGVGYLAVFALLSDSTGRLTSCSFDSLGELSRVPKPINLKPHELFVSDACRKLSSVKWKAQSPGNQKEFFMYCRYTPLNPVRAFCEQKFGE